MAGVVRSEFDTSRSDDMNIRSGRLFQIAKQLKRLSDTFNLAVVVVNQVTAGGESDRVVPALGHAWAHCVNTRIMLYRDTRHLRVVEGFDTINDENESPTGISSESKSAVNSKSSTDSHDITIFMKSDRNMVLELSPMCPSRSSSYHITTAGVFAQSETRKSGPIPI
jgi:predicted hydrocarbon binding protein